MNMVVKNMVYIKCPVCGSPQGEHADDCPQAEYNRLSALQSFGLCPKCLENGIDVNADDFWECRKCHTQFSGSGFGDTAEPEKTMTDNKDGQMITVIVLKAKGKGDFPIDKALASLQEQINKAA